MSGIETVALGLAAVSALSAASSAWFSRRAVERSHAPFVWPSIAIRSVGAPGPEHEIGIRLYNDGPGTAFNVRFTVASERWLSAPEGLYVVPPIPAIKSGEVVPPGAEYGVEIIRDNEFRVALDESLADDWYVVVRYGDGLGRRWELRAPKDPHDHIRRPSRLRRRWWPPVRQVERW